MMPKTGVSTADILAAMPKTYPDPDALPFTGDEVVEIWCEDARRDLGFFGEFVYKDDKGRPLIAAVHHLVWICACEGIEAGELKKVLIIAPPGHAKTEWISKVFSSWYVGKHPEQHLLLVSVTSSLANRISVSVRDTIEQNEDYRMVFPGVRPDRSKGWAENEWFVWREDRGDRDATFTAAGFDGAIIGRRAEGLIVDDPYDEETAQSPTKQRRVKTAFTRTIESRLKEGAWELVVMTRWVPDDLAQDLIDEGWLVVHMRALADRAQDAKIFGPSKDVAVMERRLRERGFENIFPIQRPHPDERHRVSTWDDLPGPETNVGIKVWLHGERALWPEGVSEETLKRRRRAGHAIFQLMYQGDPKATFSRKAFQREWFQIVDQAPADAKRVRYWDIAATEPKPGEDPDWSVGVRMAMKDGIFYVEDVVRARLTPKGVEDLVRQTAELDGKAIPIYAEQEPGASGKIMIDHYTRNVLVGFEFRGNPSGGDGGKSARARPLSSAAEAGNVKLVRGPWNAKFLEELEEFPSGDFDDQVDAASGAFAKLADTVRPAGGTVEPITTVSRGRAVDRLDREARMDAIFGVYGTGRRRLID